MEIRYSEQQDLPMPLQGEPIDVADLFMQLYLRSNGNAEQALEWLRRIAEQYGITNRDRTFEDILQELEEKGILKRDLDGANLTPKGNTLLRNSVYDHLFKGLRQGFKGGHNTGKLGNGGERQAETRPYRFGDAAGDVDFKTSYENYFKRTIPNVENTFGAAEEAESFGIYREEDPLRDEDFEVYERENLSNCSTVLMLDISHSMILYGEDRITPAKMTAIALVEHVRRHYPQDSIDVITFGDEAKVIPADSIAHVAVGPFHTNTCDGLRLAQQLLRRRPNGNKQIFMVTDGKPSAVFDRGRLYKNSFGLDPLVLSKTYAEARNCRKQNIRVCTFMVAQDAYLIEFVEEFSKLCAGQAFFTGLDKLGESIFVDYTKNRRKRLN